MRSIASPWTRALHACIAIGLLMLASGLMANTLASSSIVHLDSQVEFSPADEQGRYTYMIQFIEPGVIEQHRARSNAEFDYGLAANQAARDQLVAIQAQRVSEIAQAVGRSVQPSHHYLATRNGIALRLTPAEVERIAGLSGIRSIQREQLYSIQTFRGPEFIGANAIWDGSATPAGSPLRGELMVAAILDSGIPDPTVHPSFSNDPACGHGVGGVPDKVLSNLDCSASDPVTGLCNGTANPFDENGHGSHTASTTAGNIVTNSATPSPNLPAPFTQISGVAHCAHIRSYDVCSANGGSSCGGADIAAGLESVLVHTDPGVIGAIPPVAVMNYSISGGRTPWTDFDRTKLDLVDAGVFVAASAGNTSAGEPDPVGLVSHRGPWVMSVAASTHDGQIGKSVSLAGGPTGVFAIEGSGPAMVADFIGDLRWAGDVDAANVEGCNAFAAGDFAGEAALISRGGCSFAIKVGNAVAAGAAFVIVYNNAGAPIAMGGLDGTTVSSVMISTDDGNAMIAALAGGVAEVTVPAVDAGFVVPEAGDVLAGFSLRGPTPAPLQDLQKPNITAPGVNILAAVPGGYAFLSGTSMSGPHVAGAGVLVRQANPDWTVSEVKSAMQMTASREGLKDDAATPWDWDDVGHGRVDLTQAALAGLVMDETVANYLAANPATGGDVKTLNTPDVRNMDCTPSCSFTRTLRNTYDVATSWTVTPESFNPDLDIQVTPSTFSFTGDTNETVELTIVVTPLANLTAGIEFGQILIDEDSSLAPQAHLTAAISGTNLEPQEIAVNPAEISELLGAGSSTTVALDIANVGGLDLNWSMQFFSGASTRGTLDVIWDQPAAGTGGIISDEFLGSPAGDVVVLSANDFDINAAQEITEIFVPGFWNGGNINTAVALNWEIYADANGAPAGGPTGGDAPLWSYTAAPGDAGVTIADNNVTLNVPASSAAGINLPTGRHWLVFYPTINFGPDFNARWNWSQGIEALGTSHLIDPANLFGAGATDWTPQTAIGVPWPDTAFTLSGVTNCDLAPPSWLSVSDTSGVVPGASSQTVDVTLDSAGLTPGTYSASLCISSDDVVSPITFVPVEMEVVDPADLPAIDVSAASVDGAVDLFNPTTSETFDISNTGNGLDLEWSITEAQAVASQRGVSPTLSVDGVELFGGLGTPANSSVTLDIGVGNAVTGFGFEVTVEAFDPSWLSESRMAILSNAGDPIGSGASIQPDATGGPGVANASSGGIVALGAPVAANASGEIYIEWFESFTDAEVSPNSAWSDAAAPVTLPAGITLQCTDQAACDAALAPPSACESPSDVPWVSVTPTSGTTAAAASDTVTVDFDGTGLAQGLYEAVLCIDSNDPATPRVELPVSLEVTAPATAAELTGTVQGLGYCQADPILAAGATIEIVGALETITTTADANGVYSVFLDAGNSPVDITASAPNHISVTETGVTLTASATTTVDFGLVLEVPCATAAPSALSAVIPTDSSTAEILTLSNALGGADYTWSIDFEEVAATPFGGTDVVQDGSFETGTPNAAWTEFSATFGTPLCDEAGCGLGGGTGPRTGAWWTWFGGIAAAESGSVSQNVTLPSGPSAELRFWLEIPANGQPGVMEVSMDGNVLFSVTEADSAAYATYTEVVVDVSSFADGGTYALEFSSETQAGATATNFFVDDVSLVVQPGPVGCENPLGVPWLSVDTAAGTLAAGATEDLTVTFDSTGVPAGNYLANLCVNTDDAENGLIVVPVEFRVITDELFEDRFEGVTRSTDPQDFLRKVND
jgi:subtilisin family serine protease